MARFIAIITLSIFTTSTSIFINILPFYIIMKMIIKFLTIIIVPITFLILVVICSSENSRSRFPSTCFYNYSKTIRKKGYGSFNGDLFKIDTSELLSDVGDLLMKLKKYDWSKVFLVKNKLSTVSFYFHVQVLIGPFFSYFFYRDHGHTFSLGYSCYIRMICPHHQYQHHSQIEICVTLQ